MSVSTFEEKVKRGNPFTDRVSEWGYEHPEAVGRLVSTSRFVKLIDGGYARAYHWLDLITLLNPDGTLRFNLYGPHWKRVELGKYSYFSDLSVYKDYLLASYCGDLSDIEDSSGQLVSNTPSRVLVFDLEGNHVLTIDVGEKFREMAVDEQRGRLLLNFKYRDALLGYIELEPIFRNLPKAAKAH